MLGKNFYKIIAGTAYDCEQILNEFAKNYYVEVISMTATEKSLLILVRCWDRREK